MLTGITFSAPDCGHEILRGPWRSRFVCLWPLLFLAGWVSPGAQVRGSRWVSVGAGVSPVPPVLVPCKSRLLERVCNCFCSPHRLCRVTARNSEFYGSDQNLGLSLPSYMGECGIFLWCVPRLTLKPTAGQTRASACLDAGEGRVRLGGRSTLTRKINTVFYVCHKMAEHMDGLLLREEPGPVWRWKFC